jgi:hypothetical protein
MGTNSNMPGESAADYKPSYGQPHYRFVEVAALADVPNQRKILGEVEEISRRGCYLETMNVLPEGSSIELKIFRGRETFVTRGEVLYAHTRRGMGITFVDTVGRQAEILTSWLTERGAVVALI